MRKAAVMMIGTLVVLGFGVGPAAAIPPFAKQFDALYVEGNGNAAFVEAVKSAKCLVCHKGKEKKDRNAYGEELAKLLDKKEDKDNVEKIQKSLKEVAEMKNADGKTYGELIKDGKLPGGAPE